MSLTKATISKFIDTLGENRVKTKELLSSHTHFKIGGPADLFFEARSADDLARAVTTSIKLDIPLVVLGGGSNVLVSDKGFGGLAIKNRADKVRTIGFQGKVEKKQTKVNKALVEAESGTMLNKLSRYTIEESLAGLEVFLSVPGTVGGAIFNNSHYRPEKDEFIGNFVHSATLIDSQGEKKQVPQSYFRFGYDYSILQKTKETIIKATFSLKGGKKDQIWQRATKLIKRRNLRQPIGIACSGCTFRNISRADAIRLATPNHTQSTGFLIDKAGLKGAKIGKVKISEVHASFIENIGGGKAKDVIKLIEKIKKTIKQKFGVELELEIFLIGEFD